jgi:hypothetical protein
VRKMTTTTIFETPLNHFLQTLSDALNSSCTSEINILRGIPDVASQLTCHACGQNFSSRDEQAKHYRTDLHRENLRRRLLRKPRLTASQKPTESLANDENHPRRFKTGDREDTEAISYDKYCDEDDAENVDVDEDEDEEDEDEDGDETIFSFTEDNGEEEHSNECSWWWFNEGQPTVSIASLEDGATHGIEMNIALIAPSRKHLVRGGSSMLLKGLNALTANSNPVWCVLVLRSGRFIGGIFEGTELVRHKSFKRYTVRKGQGGSQSAMDSTGKKPKSAGAMLRRHGEQMIRSDVRRLIGKEWAELMATCGLVFLSVSRTMRAVFFGGDDAPLTSEDDRIRSIPFAVPRPTLSELKILHHKLSELTIIEASRYQTYFFTYINFIIVGYVLTYLPSNHTID